MSGAALPAALRWDRSLQEDLQPEAGQSTQKCFFEVPGGTQAGLSDDALKCS